MSSRPSSSGGFFERFMQRTSQEIEAARVRAEEAKRQVFERGEDLLDDAAKGVRSFADAQATAAQLQTAQAARAGRGILLGVVRAVSPPNAKDIGLRGAMPAQAPRQPPAKPEQPVAPAVPDTYEWPLPGLYDLNVRDTSRSQGGGAFGDYRNQGAHKHQGVDITADVGTPVHAATAGVATVPRYDARGYGNWVVVTQPNGSTTRYAHLDSLSVKNGDHIARGQTIGAVGRSGNTNKAADSHLHFEVRSGGAAQNPYKYYDPAKVDPFGTPDAWARALGRPLSPPEYSRVFGDG